MKKCRIIITLFIILFLAGCTRDISDKITEDDFPNPPLLTVVSSTVRNDMEISPDHEITMTFNNVMGSVNISISGVSGNTTLGSGNTSATFRAFSAIPEGTHILTVTGTDEYGQEVHQDAITFHIKKGVEPPPPSSSLIAFSSYRDGDYEIYVMKPDGSKMTPLTDNSAQDTQPAWSLSGDYIAFSSDRDGLYAWNSDIFIMRSDGSAQTNLTNSPSINEYNAFWSLDGNSIGFMTDRNGFEEYYIIDIDGTNIRPMDESNLADFYYPWIYLENLLIWNNFSGNYEIYLENFDGSYNLTNNVWDDKWASWSPNGEKIVFSSNRDMGNEIYEIYIMDADGSNQERITFSYTDNAHPCWSPF